MENLLVGKNLALSTIAKTDNIATLADGQLACFDSNGQRVTGATEFKRNSHFFFVCGNAFPGSPLNGIVINPFDFKYSCTPYKAPVRLVKMIKVAVPTQAQFDAASAACCVYHPYRYKDVTVMLYTYDKEHVGSVSGIRPFVATGQLGYEYDVPAVMARIVQSLRDQIEPLGYTVAFANNDEITVTAPNDMYFELKGNNLALHSIVTTVTPMSYSVGGDDLTKQHEIWDAPRDGYNAKFEKSLMVSSQHWKETWKVAPGTTWDTIVIETKTEYQYELLTNDNKGLWKKQFIVLPSGSSTVAAITALLDDIGSKCQHLSHPANVH